MINEILDQIAATSGKNDKHRILAEHADNKLLRDVLYKANSRRVKYFIKQIPEYTTNGRNESLFWALEQLESIETRALRGNQAIEHLAFILSCLKPEDANIIERVVKKDLKIGMDSGINKVIPGLIEETPYMGAKSYSEKLAKNIFKGGKQAFSQIKMDGRYCNAIITNNEVELFSRQGETTYVGNAPFLEQLKMLEDCVMNGELTVDGYDRYTANGMIASIVDIEGKREKRSEKETNKHIAAFEQEHGSYEEIIYKIRFTVWDMITLDEYFAKKSDRPYHERLDAVAQVASDLGWSFEDCRVSLVETKLCNTYADAMVHFQESLKRGLEGTILKAMDGAWKDGKPNWQVKMKLEMNLDLRITGFLYGNEGTKNENVISRLQVETSDGVLTTQPSGMSEALMEYVTKHQEELLGTIVEIKCSGLSQNERGDWSVLHPSVVKLRDDKDTCDSFESAKEIEEMAKSLE